MWQDYSFALGNLILAIGVIPAIRSAKKPPIATSLTMSATLFVFAITSFSLALYLSAVMQFLNVIAWGVVAAQSYRIKKRLA